MSSVNGFANQESATVIGQRLAAEQGVIAFFTPRMDFVACVGVVGDEFKDLAGLEPRHSGG
jgi:hypothetical protein